MERNIQKNGVINLVVLALVAVVTVLMAQYTRSLTAWVVSVFLGAGTLIALVSWFQMRLEALESLEKLELDEMARNAAGSALFSSTAAEIFPAKKTREQFEKYFVPVFSILLLLGLGAAVYYLWTWTGKTHPPLRQATLGLSTFGLFALVLFLLGKFSSGLSRLRNERLLRPASSYMLLGAYLSVASATAIALWLAGFDRADFYISRGVIVLLGLISLELLFSMVMEAYRPRVRGHAPRLIYDSRLVGLAGQPESIFTTAAHALDYQFGFKVSETWFYRFLQQSLAWLLLFQVAVLLIGTGLVFIEVGEAAVLERFGKPVENRSILGPGVHFKWPWPIDKVYRYNTDQIQSFNIGFIPDDEETDDTILWTKAHYKEEFNLMVANRQTAAPENESSDGSASAKKAPPVNLLTVSIPVHFQITNLSAWVYNHIDSPRLLEKAATREVVHYLVSVDMNDIMSEGRDEAAQALQSRIQAAADDLNLGARIVFVGLQDIHPPQPVAEAYEKVVEADQHRRARILSARAQAIRTNSQARATAFRTRVIGQSDHDQIVANASAQAAQFTNQLQTLQASPEVFPKWLYLQAMRSSAQTRKYVMLSTNMQDVITLNLEEKYQPLLEAFTTPAPPKRN